MNDVKYNIIGDVDCDEDLKSAFMLFLCEATNVKIDLFKLSGEFFMHFENGLYFLLIEPNIVWFYTEVKFLKTKESRERYRREAQGFVSGYISGKGNMP